MKIIEVFKLFGSIFIDSDEADKSIQKTETLAGKLGKGLGKGIKTAAKWGAAIGGAAIAAGGAMFGMAKKSADALDTIHKGSQRMGVSTKAYQEMEYWASQNGMSMDNMEKASGRLNQRLGQAADGNKKYSSALEKLGVNMDEVRAGTLSTEDAFAKSIQSLSQMENEQEKAALASELFGTKLGRELLPALNDSSLSFEDAKKKAEELGIILDEDSVNAGAKFTDTMDDVKRSLSAVGINIGAEIMPMFQDLLDWILDHMPEIQAVIKIVFEKIGQFTKVAINIFKDHLLPIFIAIFEWTKENWPTIQTIIEGVFNAIKFVWENVLSPVLSILWDILKGIAKWVGDNWDTISSIFGTVFDAIKWVWDNTLGPVLGFIMDAFKGVTKFVKDNFPGMQETSESVLGGIGKAVGAVSDAFEWLTGKIQSAWDWLTKWNDTEAKDKNPRTTMGTSMTSYAQGIHSTGLANVPFDGYRAILHKDERVLTADENKGYNGKGTNITQNITINTPKHLSPSETARENKKALQRLALQF